MGHLSGIGVQGWALGSSHPPPSLLPCAPLVQPSKHCHSNGAGGRGCRGRAELPARWPLCASGAASPPHPPLSYSGEEQRVLQGCGEASWDPPSPSHPPASRACIKISCALQQLQSWLRGDPREGGGGRLRTNAGRGWRGEALAGAPPLLRREPRQGTKSLLHWHRRTAPKGKPVACAPKMSSRGAAGGPKPGPEGWETLPKGSCFGKRSRTPSPTSSQPAVVTQAWVGPWEGREGKAGRVGGQPTPRLGCLIVRL